MGWKAAYIQDSQRLYTIATDGDKLRIRHATQDSGIKPIEVNLVQPGEGRRLEIAAMEEDFYWFGPTVIRPERHMTFFEVLSWWMNQKGKTDE